jgi:hypothetical protein
MGLQLSAGRQAEEVHFLGAADQLNQVADCGSSPVFFHKHGSSVEGVNQATLDAFRLLIGISYHGQIRFFMRK